MPVVYMYHQRQRIDSVRFGKGAVCGHMCAAYIHTQDAPRGWVLCCSAAGHACSCLVKPCCAAFLVFLHTVQQCNNVDKLPHPLSFPVLHACTR